MTSPDASAMFTVHQLRSRWKPTKDRLKEVSADHPTSIRIHRACSWLRRIEEFEPGQDLDLVLLNQWIAFNALFGQWDEAKREPCPDRDCWRRFQDRILKLDQEGRLAAVLTKHKRLVIALLDDEYLNRFYWQDPNPRQAARAKKAKFDARTWYFEKNWSLMLDRVIERIYLIRCQLAHGAATYGSGVNRKSLRRASIMLGYLMAANMLILIDHGADEDWGALCYPPNA